MSSEEGAWAVLCEHASVLNTDTLALARYHAADPGGWCDECRERER
jgi:hypothetical protein